MTSVIVYSKDRCVQCDATKRDLKLMGIEPDLRELTQELAIQFKAEHLVAAAPVVFYNGDVWGGYNPDKLKAIAA